MNVDASDKDLPMRAVQMLVLCTAFWAVSFPTMKILGATQQAMQPGAGSWFFAALCVVYRFGFAALLVGLMAARTRRRPTRLEMRQGLGLGLFGGLGILMQMDGLAHTDASTSAFLTQTYCLWIPLWLVLRERRRPAAVVVLCCAMVVGGVAVLSRLDWRTLRPGRGELETLVASVFFAAQILWLERPVFARNDVYQFSTIMFATMALLGAPVALLTAPGAVDLVRVYAAAGPVVYLAILVFFSTLGGYMLMNRWQRHVSATQAGLIYCMEPVFASALALFLPAWLSVLATTSYANETVSLRMVVGGALIVGANVLLLVANRPAAVDEAVSDLELSS